MGEYFRPWRRKIGVMILLMSCLFMAARIRSTRKIDEYVISLHENFQLVGFSAYQKWGIQISRAPFVKIVAECEFPGPSTIQSHFEFGDRALIQRRESDAFSKLPERMTAKVRQRQGNYAEFVLFDYMFVVISATLFSSWLLLSKPRHSKSVTA